MIRPVSPPFRPIRVLSGPGALGHLVASLRRPLAAAVRDPEPRALILLAVEEAAANIWEHGYGRAPGKPILVAVRPGTAGRVEVVLRDRGPLVDVSRIPPGNLKELAQRHASRGRGLALIHLFAESLCHRARGGGGNELVLVFHPRRLAHAIEERFLEPA
jgi:anti-sigma regulatory factor (Ser/Thr protein kinase)